MRGNQFSNSGPDGRSAAWGPIAVICGIGAAFVGSAPTHEATSELFKQIVAENYGYDFVGLLDTGYFWVLHLIIFFSARFTVEIIGPILQTNLSGRFL